MGRARKPPPPPTDHKPWWKRITRDLLMFSTGLLLVIHEAVLRSGPERPTLLLLYAGMMGLPTVIWADQLRRRTGMGEEEEDA